MKIILNTSFDPQFCALQKEGEWHVCPLTVSRKSGKLIWDFLQKHEVQNHKIDFIGGVSGPGGFSNLRVAGGILTSLSIFSEVEIRQISAGKVAQLLLRKFDYPVNNFVLNSFGPGVFVSSDKVSIDVAAGVVSDHKNYSGELQRMNSVELVVEKFTEEAFFVDFLPEKKAIDFPRKIEFEWKDNLHLFIYEALKKEAPQECFFPNYECPAVS